MEHLSVVGYTDNARQCYKKYLSKFKYMYYFLSWLLRNMFLGIKYKQITKNSLSLGAT